MRPRLLLVDEPSAGLDPSVTSAIFEMLRDLRDQERIAIVTVEPDAQTALAVADIGCLVIAGAITMVGTGAELLADPTVGYLFPGR